MLKKKDSKKTAQPSIYFVILGINICSIVVLSIFNYYVFHYMSGKAYLESFLSYHQNVTDLAFQNIDKHIMEPVLKLSQLYFSPIKENEPLLLPQEQSIAGSSGDIRSLSTEMKKIQKNYPFIAGIDIYYEATNTIVTGFDKIHFPTQEEQVLQYLPWYDTYKDMNRDKKVLWTQDKVYLMEEPMILYINKITDFRWNQKNIILAIAINPDSFSQYIDQNAGKFSIVTGEQQTLYESGSKNQPKEEVELKAFESTSAISDLHYYYDVDSSQFYKDYNITNRMFLYNFLISILFNIIVLLVISYYTYGTYRRRVLRLTAEAGISIQGERSFDGSLGVLTKEITNLHNAMHSSKDLLFQNAVRSVLLNRKTEEGNEKISPYLYGDSCCVVMIYPKAIDLETFSMEELQALYPPRQEDFNVLFTTIDRDGIAAILIFQENNMEQIKSTFIHEMEEFWNDFVLVSGKVFSLQKDSIKDSYKTLLEATRYRYIFTENKYLFYEQIRIENRKESGSHLKLFESIRKDFNNQNFINLEEQIEMLVTSFKNGNYTVGYCSSTLRDLVTLFYQIMQQNQLDMWVVLGYDIREYYKKISNIDVFYDWCIELCETVLKNIQQKKQLVDVDIQTQILQLVDEHLEKDITLDFLADQLNIRPDAASRMFRQIMGTGYSDYMKTRKLNKAIELMLAGASVKEVAERLGYSSAQYFIKVFKENYGITPHQYKKNQERERDLNGK